MAHKTPPLPTHHATLSLPPQLQPHHLTTMWTTMCKPLSWTGPTCYIPTPSPQLIRHGLWTGQLANLWGLEMSMSDTHEYEYSLEFSEERLVLDSYSSARVLTEFLGLILVLTPLSLLVSSRTVVVVGHCRGGPLGAGVGLSSSGGWPLAGPTAVVVYQGRTVVAASSHVHSQQYHHQQQQDGAHDDNDATTTTERRPDHCNRAMPVDHDHGQHIPVDCDNWVTRTTSTDDNNNRGDLGRNVQGDQEGDASTTTMGATMTR
ncbi:hypothetical protein EDB89DRAFT_1908351 [Lactarius sanguifluus]|nr:hypothetical protein EDB89DRAFT_1908351 [Lactarius sanguifluus]